MILNAQASGLAIKAKLFRGLGDSSRLGILETLRNTPRTVGDIVKETGLSQSNVSNHLSCLRECGLVAAEQEGRYVTYRLSDDRVAEVLSIAEELLSDVARGVYECTRYNAGKKGSAAWTSGQAGREALRGVRLSQGAQKRSARQIERGDRG
jgi:ArsR family transcriptional regulator, cadmium/lead-responsive transcriptional repressor